MKNLSVDGHGPVSQPQYSNVPENVLDVQLAQEMIKRTDKLQDVSIDMAVRVKQAREFLAWSAAHMRRLWLDWIDESDKSCKDMVTLRMAFDRESKMLTSTAKDVTEFFNSPEYLKAHATMKETVDMLDRFAAMKQNGTLDAFADFILKIKCTS